MVACSRRSILTVNDAALSAASHAALAGAGFDVITADRCDDLARIAAMHHPALAIFIAPVGGAAGVDWCRRHSRPLRSGGVPVIFVESAAWPQDTSRASRPDAAFEPRAAALEAGAAAYLRYIDSPRELLATIRALLNLTRALSDASERKDRFIATLAHELRAPLAPIRCAAELLRPERHTSRSASCQASEIIGRQVTHLCALIDDLLDVSRIGQGKVRLKRARVDPLDVVQAALEIARPVLERKHQHLACRLVPCGPVLFGDRVRLVQIVSNLLQNAGKYTPVGGRIAVLVHATPHRVRIAVCDNGIGMQQELMPELFDIFVQSDVALPDSEGGMGLGLPLARQLAELHGGHLHAYSAGSGRGSRFVLTLPTADTSVSSSVCASVPGRFELQSPQPLAAGACACDAAAVPTAKLTQPATPAACPVTGMLAASTARPPGRRRVMIVDDDVDAATALGMLLEADGHKVRLVHDGGAALAAADEFKPEAVVLDLGLPGQDGCMVARQLRRHASTVDVLLIALTGCAHADDVGRTRAAGFDRHLVKPVPLEELGRLLAN